MPNFQRSTDFIFADGGDRAPIDAAVGERLNDLLEKAERHGRFHVLQNKLTKTIGDEFGIADDVLASVVARLVSSGRVGRRSTPGGPVLYRQPSNLERTTRGLLHAVRASQQDGHACLPQGLLLASAAKILHCDETMLMTGIQSLIAEGVLISEQVEAEVLIFTAAAQAAEIAMVKRLMDLTSGQRFMSVSRVGEIAASVEKSAGVTLNRRQLEAVVSILQHPVSIVTGAPGLVT